MVDLRQATDILGFGNHADHQPAGETHLELLGPGEVHADFGDPGHVFLVTVQQVPRHQLLAAPRPVLHRTDGPVVQLVAVELANHVAVTLTATGPVAESSAARYRDASAAWSRDPGQAPPDQPADALVESAVHLGDDVGTRYGWASADSGHPEDPWRLVVRFRPTPPPDARTLRVQVGDGPVVAVELLPWDGR